MTQRAAIAAIRFGLGRRPDEPLAADPEAWLAGQLRPDVPAPALPAGLPGYGEIAEALLRDRTEREQARTAAAAAPPAMPLAPVLPRQLRLIGEAETRAHTGVLLATATPFRERLVAFWANHFAFNIRRSPVVAAHAGHYVREAIRPNVTGPFAKLLEAAVLHPVMLGYLDNNQSTGPNSPIGWRRNLGLNENLAREVLELHSVSPAAGYSQADVTAFARILTGWQMRPFTQPGGGVWFNVNRHEPGTKTLMGRTFGEGERSAPEALAFLANHPATHRHLAEKLVRHFVADTPPPAAIRRVEGALRDTRGDLGAASAALIGIPEAWDRPLTKLRCPQDYIVAVLRAVGFPAPEGLGVVATMARLGQPLWQVPAPDGWPDTAPAWTGPEAMLRRVEWAHAVAGRSAGGADPAALAEQVMGPLANPTTLREMSRAGSRRDALTLLFTSPEFQRR
ncbi:DUF1800 domain-containing protein [Plastoroseomonas arctica]|uniref:DUF1800 domain-containing protein n=1 Tax=Plastoroseomonas arctica TaxID=1509237 RepID=A0AAF1JXC1_9PROT|nr:DUF1800 domain-containing protein [Plastoroseomonas arctica]MBR0656062.1 DUF1800 domain-containing protein [Plastoroseomonas arctica]